MEEDPLAVLIGVGGDAWAKRVLGIGVNACTGDSDEEPEDASHQSAKHVYDRGTSAVFFQMVSKEDLLAVAKYLEGISFEQLPASYRRISNPYNSEAFYAYCKRMVPAVSVLSSACFTAAALDGRFQHAEERGLGQTDWTNVLVVSTRRMCRKRKDGETCCHELMEVAAAQPGRTIVVLDGLNRKGRTRLRIMGSNDVTELTAPPELPDVEESEEAQAAKEAAAERERTPLSLADAIAKAERHAELIAGKPPRATSKQTCLAKDKALIDAVNSTATTLPKSWGEDSKLWKLAFKQLDATNRK